MMSGMRLLWFRGGPPGTITGRVRVDRRTRRLAGRLRPGDIALIDHPDLDRAAAEALVSAGVAAVLNASPSISGRFPTLGPQVLVRRGVELVDDLGDGVFAHLRDGDRVTVQGNTVLRLGVPVAHGLRQDAETLAKATANARDGLAIQLEALTDAAGEYVRRDRGLVPDGLNRPALRTRIAGRPCLAVLRRPADPAELDRLALWIADTRPVLIGVDGGADALVDAGYRPDLVAGDLDRVSDRTLRCGAEIVVRSRPDGGTPSLLRLGRLHLSPTVVQAGATPEDFGLLVAHAAGASLIVTVGGQAGLVELLEQGRAAAASALLTRLTLGSALVDGATVAKLHRTPASAGAVAGVAAAGVAAMALGVLATTVGAPVVDQLAVWWDTLVGAV
jgi:uncharacterized membrane-anchored protein